MATEYDNGRVLKLMLMLNAVLNRPESGGVDARWCVMTRRKWINKEIAKSVL